MPKITALQPDPRRPGAVRVLVDGRLFCTVREAVLATAGLAVGGEWTERCAAESGQAADEEGAWRAVLKALERRNHSAGELRRRLIQRGHPPEAADYAIARAVESGLLDDARFARLYVESRAARGRGPARLRRALAALGVARSHIDAALAEQWPEPEDSLALATALARKRARQLAGVPHDARRRRLLGFLARRGFTGSRVTELVNRVLREA